MNRNAYGAPPDLMATTAQQPSTARPPPNTQITPWSNGTRYIDDEQYCHTVAFQINGIPANQTIILESGTNSAQI